MWLGLSRTASIVTAYGQPPAVKYLRLIQMPSVVLIGRQDTDPSLHFSDSSSEGEIPGNSKARLLIARKIVGRLSLPTTPLFDCWKSCSQVMH